MIDFPANPALGQQFTAAGVTWTWDGAKWTASGLGVAYLPLAGGTMLGPIVLAADPAAALQPATKQYVDGGRLGDNRIINGDMRIDQRNNGAAGTATGYTLDRWGFANTTSPTARGQWGRIAASAPLVALGFGYCLGFTSTSAYTPAAADSIQFYQPVEADMIADFAWGSANAQPVTLSFFVQSSVTGTFGGAIRNSSTNRSYPFSFSIAAASTWTRIVINIPGDTAGTWVLSGNGAGLYLNFDLGSGATYRAAAGSWTAGDFRGATGAVSVVATNGANFQITGVKLEIGSIATPFPRQSLAKNQADCERYFRWVPFNMHFIAAAAGGAMSATMTFQPAMRAAPTLTALTADPNVSQVNVNNSTNGFDTITPYGARMYAGAPAAGSSQLYGFRSAASAEL